MYDNFRYLFLYLKKQIVMDSSNSKSCTTEKELILLSPETSKMSPVSNLAFNLSSLTTSVAGTPIRRISWSNPIPGGDKIGLNLEDLSPSNTESPTCLDVDSHLRRSMFSVPYTIEDDNKENVTPKISKTIKIDPLGLKRLLQRKRLDSGYSSYSTLNNINPFENPSSSTKQNPSVFAYEEENSMDSLFRWVEDEDDFLSAHDCLNGLLTKPLEGSSRSPKLQAAVSRRGKLPIRRCLSMEVEFNPDVPSTSQSVPISETCGSRSVSYSNFNADSIENCNFKRPDPPSDLLGLESKRRRSSPSIAPYNPPRIDVKLKRSFSETAATIMHHHLKSDLQPELIGDGSRMCALPLLKGRHHDLMSISHHTLADVLNGQLFPDITDNFAIVDCRYPYEFEGGHIKGAKNIFTKDDIMQVFFPPNISMKTRESSTIVIFHCEFSSERAPTLYRFLRNKDRELNEGNYPRLYYPEMYILEGGYKAFFNSFKELCEPQTYKPMNHKDHGFELRHFRAKSKSWGADSKCRGQLRSHLKTSVV